LTKGQVAGGVLALALLLLGLVFGRGALEREAAPTVVPSPAIAPAAPAAVEGEAVQGFLYGRVTTLGGATHEGRLRWGGGEEAFWGDTFNGRKDGNRWAALVPPERLPRERRPVGIFGLELGTREREVDLSRFFMARFGDLARVDAQGGRVRVTLRSGSVVDLDRLEASDFDDGLRVWDGAGGVVDLDSLQIRSVELLPTGRVTDAPSRLHGTVRTRQGDFAGFVQWDREKCVGTDELEGRAGGDPLRLRFDTIRSVTRDAPDGVRATLLDGREVVVAGGRGTGPGHRGIYVDDRRFGRVLVSWEAFERLDLTPGGSGPGYGHFPPGGPLTGSVTTRDGRRLAGRLVYDLDESEVTETLDAPSRGVDYTIPFGLVASIQRGGPGEEGARVVLHGGEELRLEPAGDLGEKNAGLLVFVDGRERPEYVAWPDVGRVDLDRPPAMYPPLARPPAPWRRLEALEQFVVLTCAGDPSLSWIVRSREEERKLLTPKLHETCRSGTLRQLVWPCCDGDGYQVISSRARLEEVLAGKTRDPLAPAGPAPRWREAYLADVAREIPSFERETLVFLTVPYGGSGMAKATLDVRERAGVLTAEVRIELPPPPLTPDTAVFRFAFAVDRTRIRELELVTVPPAGAKRTVRKIPLGDGVAPNGVRS
jgi:hypothetical protein